MMINIASNAKIPIFQMMEFAIFVDLLVSLAYQKTDVQAVVTQIATTVIHKEVAESVRLDTSLMQRLESA